MLRTANQPHDRRPDDALTPGAREEIVRRYWLRGELTPLAVANSLAGQRAGQAA